MIRRLKAEVLSQLPPKIHQRIPFDLPKEAAKVRTCLDIQWMTTCGPLSHAIVMATMCFTFECMFPHFLELQLTKD